MSILYFIIVSIVISIYVCVRQSESITLYYYDTKSVTVAVCDCITTSMCDCICVLKYTFLPVCMTE